MKTPFQVKKILIPIDFSSTSRLALEHAAHICKGFESELHLLHVYKNTSIDVLPNITATNAHGSSIDELKSLVNEELNEIGQKFAAKYNVSYNIEIREGSVSKEIVKTASEVKADMIVMGTHGVSGFEEFFMGSNAYKVVTSATMPVLTVQEHADKMGFENIILPVDSTPHTRDKVSQAVKLAETFGSTIHIAGLVRKEEEEDMPQFNIKIKQIQEHLDHHKVKYTTAMLHGSNIAELTLDFANKVNGDLTVIMTDQENYTGFFVGPYAQRIVNHSKIPVLSVTPIGEIEGFSQKTLGGDYRPFYI